MQHPPQRRKRVIRAPVVVAASDSDSELEPDRDRSMLTIKPSTLHLRPETRGATLRRTQRGIDDELGAFDPDATLGDASTMRSQRPLSPPPETRAPLAGNGDFFDAPLPTNAGMSSHPQDFFDDSAAADTDYFAPTRAADDQLETSEYVDYVYFWVARSSGPVVYRTRVFKHQIRPQLHAWTFLATGRTLHQATMEGRVLERAERARRGPPGVARTAASADSVRASLRDMLARGVAPARLVESAVTRYAELERTLDNVTEAFYEADQTALMALKLLENVWKMRESAGFAEGVRVGMDAANESAAKVIRQTDLTALQKPAASGPVMGADGIPEGYERVHGNKFRKKATSPSRLHKRR